MRASSPSASGQPHWHQMWLQTYTLLPRAVQSLTTQPSRKDGLRWAQVIPANATKLTGDEAARSRIFANWLLFFEVMKYPHPPSPRVLGDGRVEATLNPQHDGTTLPLHSLFARATRFAMATLEALQQAEPTPSSATLDQVQETLFQFLEQRARSQTLPSDHAIQTLVDDFVTILASAYPGRSTTELHRELAQLEAVLVPFPRLTWSAAKSMRPAGAHSTTLTQTLTPPMDITPSQRRAVEMRDGKGWFEDLPPWVRGYLDRLAASGTPADQRLLANLGSSARHTPLQGNLGTMTTRVARTDTADDQPAPALSWSVTLAAAPVPVDAVRTRRYRGGQDAEVLAMTRHAFTADLDAQGIVLDDDGNPHPKSHQRFQTAMATHWGLDLSGEPNLLADMTGIVHAGSLLTPSGGWLHELAQLPGAPADTKVQDSKDAMLDQLLGPHGAFSRQGRDWLLVSMVYPLNAMRGWSSAGLAQRNRRQGYLLIQHTFQNLATVFEAKQAVPRGSSEAERGRPERGRARLLSMSAEGHDVPPVPDASDLATQFQAISNASSKQAVQAALATVQQTTRNPQATGPYELTPTQLANLQLTVEAAQQWCSLTDAHANMPPHPRNAQLFLCSYVQIMLAASHGPDAVADLLHCRSGKDRSTMQVLHTQAMLVYAQLYGHLPTVDDGPADRAAFANVFADVYVVSVGREHANANANGSFGLKGLGHALFADTVPWPLSLLVGSTERVSTLPEDLKQELEARAKNLPTHHGHDLMRANFRLGRLNRLRPARSLTRHVTQQAIVLAALTLGLAVVAPLLFPSIATLALVVGGGLGVALALPITRSLHRGRRLPGWLRQRPLLTWLLLATLGASLGAFSAARVLTWLPATDIAIALTLLMVVATAVAALHYMRQPKQRQEAALPWLSPALGLAGVVGLTSLSKLLPSSALAWVNTHSQLLHSMMVSAPLSAPQHVVILTLLAFTSLQMNALLRKHRIRPSLRFLATMGMMALTLGTMCFYPSALAWLQASPAVTSALTLSTLGAVIVLAGLAKLFKGSSLRHVARKPQGKWMLFVASLAATLSLASVMVLPWLQANWVAPATMGLGVVGVALLTVLPLALGLVWVRATRRTSRGWYHPHRPVRTGLALLGLTGLGAMLPLLLIQHGWLTTQVMTSVTLHMLALALPLVLGAGLIGVGVMAFANVPRQSAEAAPELPKLTRANLDALEHSSAFSAQGQRGDRAAAEADAVRRAFEAESDDKQAVSAQNHLGSDAEGDVTGELVSYSGTRVRGATSVVVGESARAPHRDHDGEHDDAASESCGSSRTSLS